MLRLCFKIIAAGFKKGLPLFSFMWHKHSCLCSRLDIVQGSTPCWLAYKEKIVDRRRPRLRHLTFFYFATRLREPSLDRLFARKAARAGNRCHVYLVVFVPFLAANALCLPVAHKVAPLGQ
jgi:hypothetical protein